MVDLTDLLGDAKSDFTPSLIERMTYQGKLYAVPQVTDMQLLVYRKSLLEHGRRPAAGDRRRAARRRARLTTDKVKGLFVGNDGGVGVLGGPLLWSAGLDYLTEDDRSASTTRRPRGAGQAARAVHREDAAAGRRPTGPTRPRSARA